MRTLVLAMLAAAQIQFDVVSIKPGDPSSPESSVYPLPNGLRMKNATLKSLIQMAYGLNQFQIAGGPKWLDSKPFDIDAKSPPDASGQIPLMLQAMLADRFKLECHRENRTVSEYALVGAKGGPKLQPASEDDKKRIRASQGDRQIKISGAPVSELAHMLIAAVGAPVVDRTGIEGQYNFNLQFAPLMGGTPADDRLPDIFTAVQQLGLKLEPIKGPIDTLVIDKVEMPSEN